MAIAYDLTTNSTGIIPEPPADPVVTVSHTTSGSDRLLVVCAQVYTQTVTGITYAGTSMTLATSVANGNFLTYLYYLANPALGADNVVITFNASGGQHYSASINSYTGVDQTTPLDATNTATGSSTTGGTVTVTTVADNCWVVDSLIRNEWGQSGITVGAGQTERYNTLVGGYGYYGGTSDEGPKTPAGDVVMNWTWSIFFSLAWATVAASFKPAGEAGTVVKDLIQPGVIAFPR